MVANLRNSAAAAREATRFTVADIIRGSARAFADRIAVVSPDVELTYRELDARSNRLAHVLADLGLVRGDRLAVVSTTRPEYVELYLAAAKAGVTVIALNTRVQRSELLHCLRLGSARVLFASSGFSETAGDLAASMPAIEQVLTFPEFGGDPNAAYERLLAGASPSEPARVSEPEDIHCVLFTSGTTGTPKGAMISQRASVARAARIVDWFRLTPDDGLVGWIPMFHTGGDECVQATLLSGGTFATFEQADPVAMFEGIARHRLTWTPMLPGLITDVLDHPERQRHDLSSLRFTLGYANMMPQTVERFTTATDSVFWDAFGQTESSFLVAVDPIHPGETPSLHKRPVPLLDVRIVDEHLQEVPVGVPGECVVRGPTVMSGYLEDPAATAEVFRGGWLHTGDVLVRHEDGTLSYVDRLKYLIKTGGESVYPAEIERVLTQHPAVREACVISVPDPRWGETVKAVVVAEPGHSLAAREVGEWCRERLPGFKRPRFVEFVAYDDVPRSTTGKILRRELEGFAITDEQRI